MIEKPEIRGFSLQNAIAIGSCFCTIVAGWYAMDARIRVLESGRTDDRAAVERIRAETRQDMHNISAKLDRLLESDR